MRRRMTSISVTPELIQTVHEAECDAHGHALDLVVDYGTREPTGIRCKHCDRTWPVGPGVEPAAPGPVARAVCHLADAV